jgi:autotransporter-associated beta strand protein
MRKALLVSMAVFANLIIGPRASDAATCIWTGGGGNSLWSTPGNWVANDVPNSGDLVVIPANVAASLGNNNLNNLVLSALVVQHEYTLSGSELTIGGNGLHVASLPGNTDVVSIVAPLRLSGAQTWNIENDDTYINNVTMTGTTFTIEVSQTGELRISGTIAGSGTLEKTGDGMLRLAGNNTYAGRTNVKEGYLVLMHAHALGVADGTTANGTFVSGNPAGAGTLHIANVAVGNEALEIYGPGQNDNGALQASGTAAFGGPITLPSHLNVNVIAPAQLTFNGPIKGVGRVNLANSGTFVFANSNNTYTGGLGIGDAGSKNSKVTLAADEAIPGAPVQNIPANTVLTLDAGIEQTLKNLIGAGTLRLTDAQSRLLLTGNFVTTFDGSISGAGTIRYTGTGQQLFTGTINSWTGQLIVQSGLVSLVNAQVSADAVAGGAGTLVLSGTAKTGSVLVDDGGVLRVENGATTAATVNTDDLMLTPGAVLRLDGLAGSGNGPGTFGRIDATGTVTVAGDLVLVMPPGFTAPAGTVFTLIANDGNDAVVGQFANAPAGTKFTWGSATYQLAYNGGDGNDVTLSLASVARDYILSEGATGPFFLTEIVIGNPNDQPAPIRVSFLKPGGGAQELDIEVPAMARRTIVANDLTALDVSEFSTVVRSLSGLPLVVERTMTWDRETGYGAHTERAAEGPASKWYFAEGSQGFFSTYLLLANPNATPSEVNVEYLIEGGEPFTRTYDVPALSRLTIDAGTDPKLVDRSFGMVVTFPQAQPGLAERAMYFGADPLWKGGHAAAGATSPSTSAYVAEGATGPFFETYVLIANPNLSPVDVNLTFGRQADTPIAMTRTIPASSRLTLNLETLDPGLANTPVSTRVEASLPVIVERAQYWPDPAPQWYEAHSSAALQALGTKWGLAEGRVGGPSAYQTYILLANTNAAEAHVSITFLRESGAPFTKSFTVPGTQRLNVPVGPGTDVPELVDERFGALIVSDQPIAVERAMYANAGGQIWAAGTSANATPVP